ncbi:MAG: serine hydrolase [Pseudomonadota bacterium]
MVGVQTTTDFPGVDWETAEPEEMGMDAATLASVADTIFDIETRYGFLVVKRGRVVYERYKRDVNATNHIFSVTKGLGATLIGIAEHQGLLSTSDRIADWLPVHHPDIAPDAQIRHVLNMTAGSEPAGTHWAYNSNYILNSLTGILWLASGMSPASFYEKNLKQPIQLSFDWPSNDKGWIQIGSQGPLPVIEATHRDIARMGLLWMHGGRWESEQMMSSSFVAEALTSPYPKANGAYGYLWWLNRDNGTWRTTAGRSGTGRWFPYMPDNVFMALGARGKVMIVVPDHELIMVSMGDTEQEQSANYLGTMMQCVARICGYE